MEPQTRWLAPVYLCVLAVAGVCFLWARQVHELSFPVPWPDEGSFLWPALAFRDHLSLYAPELYPTREVYWMPPGFMVLEGCIFKLWTFSLGRARLLSALFLLAALGSIASILRNSRVRLGHAAIIAVFLFSPIFRLAGNTARMETLELLVASVGCVLLDRKRWAGVFVLSLGPLVHPIGCIFFFVGSLYWFFAVRDRMPMRRGDRIVLGVASFLWLAYAAHVVPHFRWFYEDLAGQMKFKSYVSASNGGVASRLREPLMLAAFAGVVASVFAAVRLGARTRALVVLCVSSLLASTLTQGWLYDIYPGFAALLGSVLILESGAVFFTRKPSTVSSARTVLPLAGLSVLVVYVDAAWASHHPFLMRSVQSSTAPTWAHDPSYASPEERYEVSEFLRKITPQRRTVTVQILPDADALFFESVRTPTLRFAQQTFYTTNPDVYIVHRSPWFPPLIFEVELMSFVLRNGVTMPLQNWQEIARGPGDSRWLVLRRIPGKIDWW